MVRMQSCHGNEFTPLFRGDVDEDEDEGSEESNFTDSDGEVREIEEVEDEEEVEDIDGAFADAKDCWKIDAETLKGFYLHSPTGQLFSWDQARGVLYEYLRGSGECRAIWAAGAPHLSSEIWSILPLPPTDPASLQVQSSSSSSSSGVLCILHLSRARAAQRAATASADFCDRLHLGSRAMEALLSLPPAGQAYVLRTFCAPPNDPGGALVRQVGALKKLGGNAPYANAVEEATLRVPASGAILGRCVPEIAALCWNDTDPVAAAHCRITCVNGEYSVCDLVADEDGTHYDGRRLGTEWCPLKDGCKLDIGPIRMEVELKPFGSTGQKDCVDKKKPMPKRGSWRAAKRLTTDATETASEKRLKRTSCQSQPESTPVFGSGPASESPESQALANTQNTQNSIPSKQMWTANFSVADVDCTSKLSESFPSLSPPRDRDLLRLQKQRAHCPSVGGGGRAFWAIPRDPSPERQEDDSPEWVPRTPP